MTMTTTFSHPLARKAKVWKRGGSRGGILTIVTKLELDPEKKRFKTDLVKRLSEAATEWLSFNQDKATDFVLMSRTKDW
jgi:hypothetical protein